MKNFSAALTNIRRSPYQSLAAVLLLTITFFVSYTFSLFLIGTEQILRYFETRPQIIAFFEVDTEADVLSAAETSMQAKPYVEEVTVVTQDEALAIYQESNKEDPLLLELVTADILPASIEVSGDSVESLPQIRNDLESLSGVEEVIFQQNIVDMLKNWTNSVRLIGIGSIVLLAGTSFLTIMVITGMKIRTKRTAVNIMRMIGASGWYIKAPFIHEGIMYGVLGSLLGWSLMYVGLLYITPWLKDFLGTIPLLPIPVEILALQLGIGTAVGVLLTSFASLTAVSRIIRK